jgi:hypothetical protein
MNIAFPALIVLILALPGAIFRYTYARGSWGWSSPISFRSVSDELAYSAVFAVGLHFIWLGVGSLGGNSVDIPSLLAMLSGNYGVRGERYESSLNSIASHAKLVGFYQLSLLISAAILGWLGHKLVRWAELDLKTQIFRFRNEWHYLLTGEILKFKEVRIEAREIDGVFLSAVIDHGASYLYRGIVEDWSFNSDGQLDTIRLRVAHRRLLSADRKVDEEAATGDYIPPDERYYEIHGDLFVLRYSEVKTLNLDYFSLSEVSADESGENDLSRD